MTAATPGQPAPVSPHLECTVCASGVTSPHGVTATPGQAAREAVPEVYRRWLRIDQPKNWAGPSDSLVSELWHEKSDEQKEFWRSLDAAQEPDAADEAAAATAETRRMRDIVCKLLDLFSTPDDRLMQHASVTRATLLRYAGEAGVRLDGLPS